MADRLIVETTPCPGCRRPVVRRRPPCPIDPHCRIDHLRGGR